MKVGVSVKEGEATCCLKRSRARLPWLGGTVSRQVSAEVRWARAYSVVGVKNSPRGVSEGWAHRLRSCLSRSSSR